MPWLRPKSPPVSRGGQLCPALELGQHLCPRGPTATGRRWLPLMDVPPWVPPTASHPRSSPVARAQRAPCWGGWGCTKGALLGMKLRPGKSCSITRTEHRPEPGRWGRVKPVITTLVPPYLLWPVPPAPAAGAAAPCCGGLLGAPAGALPAEQLPPAAFLGVSLGAFQGLPGG